ncbi:MAG: DnaJ domain-containing protein [Acidobacteriota bacterium]
MTTTAAGAQPLLDLLRTTYLDRASGRLELEDPGMGASVGRSILLRRGELYIDRDSELAQQLGPIAERAAGLERPAADEEIAAAIGDLATRLTGARGRLPRARLAASGSAIEVLGPLPLVSLALALAVEKADEAVLIARLGGLAARWRGRDETPAMTQLPRLDPSMVRVVTQLEKPISLEALLRGADRLETLRGLAKLWIVGLAERDEDDVASPVVDREVVSEKALQRFLENVGGDLEARPLDLPTEKHRALLADLVGTIGSIDHYQLLDLPIDAGADAVSAAYQRVARRVHPGHAAALGLGGKEDTVRLLFEKATEAYLVLSDPVRRSSYNTLMGIQVGVRVEKEQRDEEKKRMARAHFVRGSNAMAEMDYSTAVEMLKEAARLDPQVRYLNLLAQSQAKNPRWRRHAVYTYQQAIELAPDDGGLRLALAQVLEKEDRIGEARTAYVRTLEVMPDSVVAKAALDRLGGKTKRPTADKSEVGPRRGLRDILSRRKS